MGEQNKACDVVYNPTYQRSTLNFLVALITENPIRRKLRSQGWGAGAAWEKNQEPEPEPLKKKLGAGAGAAKKFAGSPALSVAQ